MTYNNSNDNVFSSDLSVNSLEMGTNSTILCTDMIGQIEMFYTTNSNPPTNFLWCDGSLIQKSDNPEYESLIKIITNSNTATQCYLPNMKNCNIKGNESTFNTYQSDQGNTSGNYTVDINQFPSHNHIISNNNTSNAIINSTISYDNNVVQKNGSISINATEYFFNGMSGSTSNWTGDRRENEDRRNTAPTGHTHNYGRAWYNRTSYYTNTIKITKNTNNNANILGDSQTSGSSSSSNNYIPYSIKVKFAIRYQ